KSQKHSTSAVGRQRKYAPEQPACRLMGVLRTLKTVNLTFSDKQQTLYFSVVIACLFH
ncbi:MAG: hypothetical protein ACI909_004310, partial [Planctomycetota bacterium]